MKLCDDEVRYSLQVQPLPKKAPFKLRHRKRALKKILSFNNAASKNLSILTQKLFLSSRKYDPGCSFRIRIMIFTHPRSRS